MKTIENVKVFVCDFCKKKLFRQHAMLKHEDFCSRNPKNFSACSGCVFMKEEETEVYYSNSNIYGDEETTTVKTKAFYCKKLDKHLYPFKVVAKGLLEKYPETFEGQEQMPVKCEHWNYHE